VGRFVAVHESAFDVVDGARSPATATASRQAPVAERPLVLPPEIREPMSCHCSSNQHRRRALGAAPRRSLPPHSRRANGFSWFDARVRAYWYVLAQLWRPTQVVERRSGATVT